ncbi:MAG: chloride channel protein [Betaproteobacteria bacterium]|uniref:chloride channel protein n=1 Tax=Thiomonas sp. TaxID=2047785 RepID=UPI00238D2F8D|nr:chloride channel protein [Thiomonas sp.]MDE2129685.1 chloride channel protein [Betaproteobacteria bacterium]
MAHESEPPASAETSPRLGTSRRRALTRLIRSRSRRLLLQFGLPWGGALLVGLAAVLYANWSTAAYNQFVAWIAGRPWLAFLITPAFTVLAVFLTRRWFSGSEGSGIPQVIAALHAPRDETLMKRLFGLRVIFGKLFISLLGFLGGMTIGREGPTVHIGAAIMAETRRFYPHRGPRLERQLLLAGAAAGLSGAFNTPLAGIIFAIEEIARDFENRTNGTMITAVVFSGLTSLALAGNYLYFGQLNVPHSFSIHFVLPVLLTALLCGLLGAAFNWALLRWEVWMPRPLQLWRADKPLLYALIIGLAIAALGVSTGGETWGSGYEQARRLLEGTAPLSQGYAITKWASMIISYMAGIPGGLFSPSLSIGAGLAQWVHAVFAWAPLPALIALCMTGYLAAVTQSPLTSFVIVMEMTNGSGMVIPMMATALLATRVSALFTPPLYEALAQKNYFPKAPAPQPAPEARAD